jgi:hypothetical protein
VYDIRGRRVRELVFPGGEHLVVWPGVDDAGRRLAAGTYVVKLSAGGTETLRKVVLLN